MIVERLTQLISARQFTQRQLAAVTGYRQSDISRLVRGDMKHPPLEMLDALARACGYRLADLLADELPAPTIPAEYVQVVAALAGMPPETRATMIRLVLAAAAGAGRTRPPTG